MSKPFGLFSQLFLADSWADISEMQAINSQNAQINSLSELQDFTSQRITKLFELDRLQGKDLLRLQVMIETLATMLIDAGVIDKDVFMARIENRLEELDPPPPAPGSAAAKAGPMTSCEKCGTKVPMSQTNVTLSGTFCDRCFATMPA